jgi:DNA-binding XRE family transcriptional regulator
MTKKHSPVLAAVPILKRNSFGRTVSVDKIQNQLGGNDEFVNGYRVELIQYEIGKKLKQIRIAAGLSQRELAKIAGMTQAIINRIESSHNPSNPTLETLIKLSGACGRQPRIEFDHITSFNTHELKVG